MADRPTASEMANVTAGRPIGGAVAEGNKTSPIGEVTHVRLADAAAITGVPEMANAMAGGQPGRKVSEANETLSYDRVTIPEAARITGESGYSPSQGCPAPSRPRLPGGAPRGR